MGKNGTDWNDMVARNLPECRAHVRKKISTQVRIYGLTVGYLAPQRIPRRANDPLTPVTQPLSSSSSSSSLSSSSSSSSSSLSSSSKPPSQQLHPRDDLLLKPMIEHSIHQQMGRDRTGQDKTKQNETKQDKTGQDRTGQDETRRDGTGRDGTGRTDGRRDRTKEMEEEWCRR
ncbi:unnamed protein product [Acanthocheilonema viteae]|uniref:Uncharacterized protein n=1 Tax=Acanthocheilonema viteae TaxID=6277 RepID=A0A498SQC2_ACAVI|nr:unnamed protein product [Acanthocheilonema viteae]